jgi:SAM-dependent methyltransferase
MTTVQRSIMDMLYRCDVWEGFQPANPPGPEIQGWNGNHPSLERMAATRSPDQIVIDVGVWQGQSTITMANAMREHGIDGCVIAVDTFLGSIEHWNEGLFARAHGAPDLYRTFLENVYHSGLTGYVIPLPQTSTTAAALLARLGISASVVHIDAAHEYPEVLRDAEEYWKILRPGGWLIGDDYHETWPGVVQAAGEFSARLRRPLIIEPPKWLLQKV